MDTGFIVKIADLLNTGFWTDSMMQIMSKGKSDIKEGSSEHLNEDLESEDNFSFVFIGKRVANKRDKEEDKDIEKNIVLKYTVRKSLLDLCLL